MVLLYLSYFFRRIFSRFSHLARINLIQKLGDNIKNAKEQMP